jgi:hypothetical protein
VGNRMLDRIRRNRAVPLMFISDLYKAVYDLLSVMEDLKNMGVEVNADYRVQHALDLMSKITGEKRRAPQGIVRLRDVG